MLAADTVVAAGRRILPKADGDEEVERCVRLLSGRRHQVLTALALKPPGKPMRTKIVTTRVSFKVLSPREIAAYVASGEGVGKAGGYAVQGRAEAFVRRSTAPTATWWGCRCMKRWDYWREAGGVALFNVRTLCFDQC